MSDETTNKTGRTLPSHTKVKEQNSSGGMSSSASKTPLSTLSPHVAEFIPKSLALMKGAPSNEALKSTNCTSQQRTQEKTANSVGTVNDWSGRVKVDKTCDSRGWWEETPLKVTQDGRSTISAPKSHHIRKELSGKSMKHQREHLATYSWGQKRLNEEMESNWRMKPTDGNEGKVKSNELGFMKEKREERKKDFTRRSNVPQNKEGTSFQAKKFPGPENRSGEDGRRSMLGAMGGVQQVQQRSVQTVSRRGRGRGRTAWMDVVQKQNNSIGNDEHKDLKMSNSIKIAQENDKRQRGSAPNKIDSFGYKQPLNSDDVVRSKKDVDSEFSKRKNKEKMENLTMEDDGWIVVGSKKKMDEEKGSGIKQKESIVNGKKLSEKVEERNGRDEKSVLLNSHQKGGKWKRSKDQKVERKMETTKQERQIIQNKGINSEINASKSYGKQIKQFKGKKEGVFLSEEEETKSTESERRTDKKQHKKEPRKVEVVKIIKNEENTNHKEVKILLKKNSEDCNLSQDDKTIIRYPEFELQRDGAEFPDLAASSKAGSSSLASDWLSGGTRMPIISYSAVLKTLPKPKTPTSRNTTSENISTESQEKMDNDGKEGQGKKKKKKKKKKAKDSESKVKQTTQEPKKTKQPMQFDLGDWLTTIEKHPPKICQNNQTYPKKAVTIATGVLQIKVKDEPKTTAHVHAVKATHVLSATDKSFHNILDSTAPVIKRGKEREVPRKKKPSQLKRIILKEREEKRKALEGDENEEEKEEHKSLTDDAQSSGETTDIYKAEEILSKEDNDVTICQSKEDAITHHNGNTITSDDPISTSDGNWSVAPSKDDVKAQIHSRRFREYCDNVMDKELNNTTLELLQKLVMFQDRQYHKDPIKSKAKRRFVVGLREVTKHLKLKKIKLVIVSPNVERIKSAGGLDDTLHNIISIAHQNGVPVVFALRRQVLGRVLHKKVPVSAIGVFYYDGAQDEYKKLMDLTEKAREVYAQRWKSAYDELMERIRKERAVEMAQDKDLREQGTEGLHDEGGKESGDEVRTNYGNDHKEHNLEVDGMTQDWDKESENKRSKESEQEEKNEMKDEILDQKESSCEESEDKNECGMDSTHIENMELNETNEEMDEWNNDNQSIAIETELTVEDL